MATFVPDTMAQPFVPGNNATTYHVLMDGRWEVRATPPCRGIKKMRPLSLGFYASAADAKAASIEYYEACPALMDVPSAVEFQLRCENLALTMQVTSLLTEAKIRSSELAELRERACDLTLEEIPLSENITARSKEREHRRRRAASPQEEAETLFGGC